MSRDFTDWWRAEDDRFVHTAEDRWIRDEGYTKFMAEAIQGLFKKFNLSAKDFAKVIIPCLYVREHGAIGKSCGFKPEQIQAELLTTVGDSGAAHPLMMLVAALQEAKRGDKILVASYGNGSDAVYFEVTKDIVNVGERRGMKKHLALKKELASYERYLAFRDILLTEQGILDPRTPYPLVNLSMAYARQGDSRNAEQSLRKALKLDPRCAAAHFNLGLLFAEQKKMKQAESEIRLALKYDPQMAEAAYNLGVLTAKASPAESLTMLRKARELSPDVKYAYTLAFYERKAGNSTEAAQILREAIAAKPAMADPYLLLGEIYESGGLRLEAARVYKEAADNENLPARDRGFFERKSQLMRR